VRALRRPYPVGEMPNFVRATDEKHRRKLAAQGATAVETGPQESALLLGGALLSTMGLPKEEVVQLIDDARTELYSTRMKDVFAHEDDESKRNPFGLKLLRTPAEKAAVKAKEIAAEIEQEIVDMEAEIEAEAAAQGMQDASDASEIA